MTADPLLYFISGMIVGIFLTVVLSCLAINLYKSEVLNDR